MDLENKFKDNYILLNNEQKEAVDSIYGPVMVVAGPGTGKTQIISLRTANIITKTGIDARNILITTFTEAGVTAIKKRLLDFLGTDSYKVNVCTIHSFCNDVISTFPEKFLEYRAYRLIDDIEGYEMIENIIDEGVFEVLVSEYDKYYYVKTIKDKIGKLKQEGILPQDFWRIIEKQKLDYEEEMEMIDPKLKKFENTKQDQIKHIKKLEELHTIYKKFLETSRFLGVYDFSDMIDFVLKKFTEDEGLRYHYAEKFQFIMVDEYQDTNNAQNAIVDLILSVSDDKNILVVGDDDQSIYRFQGANLENMLNFSSKYVNTKFVVLKENYRSTKDIINVSQNSIRHNTSRITNYIKGLEKTLSSNRKENIEVESKAFLSNIEEKTSIIEEIRNLTKDIKQEEIAIIVRTNKEVQEWSSLLAVNSFSVQSKLNSNILDSKFISYLLNLLEVIKDPFGNELRLTDILRSGIWNISKVELIKILRKLSNINYRLKEKKKIFDFLLDEKEMNSLYPEEDISPQSSLFDIKDTRGYKKEFEDFAFAILDCQELLNQNFYSFFKFVIEKSDFVGFVERKGSFDDLLDIYSLLEHSKIWSQSKNEFTLESFLKKISYYKKYNILLPRNISSAPKGGINVLTAHQSKGLEYDAVFVPNLVEGNWAKKKTRDLLKLPFGVIGSNVTESLKDVEETEEERRLFFVAVTRAKKHLFLSHPMGENNKPKTQCQFMQETQNIIKIMENIDISSVIINELESKVNIEKLEKDEECYILEFLKNYKLSPSDLNKFLDDPKMFLRDTIFKYPFEDNEFTIFGKVYHKALEYFYLEFKNTGVHPGISFIQNKFTWLLGQEILTPEEYERLKEKGLNGLVGWYDLNITDFKMPVELEYDFRPRGILFDSVPLTGKIDKIEEIYSNEVGLVDYKTGKSKSTNEILGTNKNSDGKYFRQLLFYKIMFDLDQNLSSKYNAKNLTIEFVEGKDNKYPVVTIPYTEDDIERVKNEIRDTWNKINDIDFWRNLL